MTAATPPPPATALADWVMTFRPFGWMHALSLAWTLGAMVAACWLGRRWLARGRYDLEQRLASAWGGFCLCVNVWSIVFWSLPGQFNVRESLPLQLCDIACLIAPLVLLTGDRAGVRWARTLVFFWGIGLSTQAFFTPTLLEGPGHMKYYLFWLVHLAIVGTAVYDIAVRRYRPTVRDLLVAIAATLVWAIGVFFLNTAIGSNYGYIGNTTPEAPTIIDRIGPWPQRVFILTGIVIALFVAMWFFANLFDRIRPSSRLRPRTALLHCSKCGFDLTSTPTARSADHCPECGTPVTQPGV